MTVTNNKMKYYSDNTNVYLETKSTGQAAALLEQWVQRYNATEVSKTSRPLDHYDIYPQQASFGDMTDTDGIQSCRERSRTTTHYFAAPLSAVCDKEARHIWRWNSVMTAQTFRDETEDGTVELTLDEITAAQNKFVAFMRESGYNF